MPSRPAFAKSGNGFPLMLLIIVVMLVLFGLVLWGTLSGIGPSQTSAPAPAQQKKSN